jgi:hypothetical protein
VSRAAKSQSFTGPCQCQRPAAGPADLLGKRFDQRRVDVVDQHRRPRLRDMQRHGPANATARAGNDDGFVQQVSVHRMFLLLLSPPRDGSDQLERL